MDEWERYVEDQKYARSLGWKAEAGHVRGLIVTGLLAFGGICGALWLVFFVWRIIIDQY